MIEKLLSLLNPECAHNTAIQLLRARYALTPHQSTQSSPINILGLPFKNKVGLAAGWDKNGVCFDALLRLGFGFVEVGTVTPQPQPGNPKPRLFRIPKKNALINRMGFNNDGVDALAQRLQSRKETGVVGVNIGKNKTTLIENAMDDYQYCMQAIYVYADYIVINISSPNTPELRALQTPRYLPDLLRAITNTKKILSARYHRDVPILVKTSVDLAQTEYAVFLQTILDAQIDGLIISNTTVDHTAVANEKYGNEAGGLSGKPLLERALNMVHAFSVMSQGKLPIIGCGGVSSGVDAKRMLTSGAMLVQIYTGFVYRGPALIQEIIDHI